MYEFYKENENDEVWSVDHIGFLGEILFSFDKVKVYNLFLDTPHNLPKEQFDIFAKENPVLADLVRSRYES